VDSVQDSNLAPLFGDLGHSENLSEIKPPFLKPISKFMGFFPKKMAMLET
jgi:hypothetical protein